MRSAIAGPWRQLHRNFLQAVEAVVVKGLFAEFSGRQPSPLSLRVVKGLFAEFSGRQFSPLSLRVVKGLFAEFSEAASGGGGSSSSRRAAPLLDSDKRRHSDSAVVGGEQRVPSPAFSPPQDPPSAWQGRNLLSPSHGQ